MTLYNCPSPKNTNNAGLYLTKAGHLVDRHGRDWGRSSMRRMALDAELDGMTPSPSANEDDGCEEKMKALRMELERLIDVDGLGLLDKSKGAIIKLLNKHCPDTWHRDGGAKAKDAAKHHRRARDEDDEEWGPEALRRYLEEHTGLAPDVIADACALCEQAISERGKISDELPVAGAKHALSPRNASGVIKKHREPGEPTFEPSAYDTASCLKKFPDLARVGVATPGTGQFDDVRGRRSRRERRIAADAVSADAGAKLVEKFVEHFASVKVGEWR
jgi:hypothetical protein